MVTALELVIEVLAEATGLPVSSKVQREASGVFLRVEQAAPTAFSPSHDKTMIIVQVYGPHTQLEDILETIGKCRDFLRFELADQVPAIVGWDEVSGPVEFPDPDIQDTYARWQFVGYVFTTLA